MQGDVALRDDSLVVLSSHKSLIRISVMKLLLQADPLMTGT